MKPGSKPLLALALILVAASVSQQRGCDLPDLSPTPPPIALDIPAVLVVYESGTPLSMQQQAITTGTVWQQYVLGVGGDARIHDQHTDFVKADDPYKAAIDASDKIPRVVISVPGKGGTTVPLPEDNDAMLALIKEWM